MNNINGSLMKLYGRYGNLFKQYEAPSLSRMLHGILEHEHMQWHPPLITLYTNLWPFYRAEPNDWVWHFCQIPRGFHRTLQWVSHANRGRIYLRTPGILPYCGLAYVLILTPVFPTLSCFRTLNFEHPSVHVFLIFFAENHWLHKIKMHTKCESWLSGNRKFQATFSSAKVVRDVKTTMTLVRK